jgi:hypothetical protein
MYSGHETLPEEFETHSFVVQSGSVNLVANKTNTQNVTELLAFCSKQPVRQTIPSYGTHAPEERPPVATNAWSGQPSSLRARTTTQYPSTNTWETSYVQQHTFSSATRARSRMTAPEKPMLVEEQPPAHYPAPQRVRQDARRVPFSYANGYRDSKWDDDPQEDSGDEARHGRVGN